MFVRPRLTVGLQFFFLFLFITAGYATDAPVAPEQLSPALTRKIDADVKSSLDRFGVPGAAVMVIQGGKVSLVQAFGARDVAQSLPIRPDTYFEIGSITKQFTAASILQLQEAGKLKIDQLLSEYLPDAPHAKEVTLRQLLTHTSGLHEYFDEQLAAQPIAYKDLIARVASLPLDFAPGSRWSYSNTGYLLLGKVIEVVSGESYRAYLQHHIFDPLDMKQTYTTGDEGRLANMEAGYRRVNGKVERAPITDPSWANAAGLLVMTLNDLAKWDTALRSGKVVSMSSYKEMTTAFMTTANGSANYGLGLFVDSAYGQPRIGHTGGSLGFTAADEFFPRQDVRIIALTNLHDDGPEAGETLTNILYADLFPEIVKEANKPARGENATVTETMRDAFRELRTGDTYERFAPHLKEKLVNGIGATYASEFRPYGPLTGEIFKGTRQDGKQTWYDYVLEFGPGVFLPFSVKIGEGGVVYGLSVG
jgi:D-alanyl-D-alanine carboxypeptidase